MYLSMVVDRGGIGYGVEYLQMVKAGKQRLFILMVVVGFTHEVTDEN